MLDTDTKRRIDTARDILVGKVPDPKSQVEQITIALIYKFMDDMDAEAEEFGGHRNFFAGDYARYGWAKLMRSGLGGHEMLNLYAEAITKMPENPGIPPLFRDIFKNAFLPYRNPETLRAFLKIIDEFEYDHSERLGDAFEYLLSVLGSQGAAGQFRTPRHIIDFIVEVIAPRKNETILDPACGTAGFLISSYKHIVKANTDGDGNITLTPDERGRLAANLKGYDISPDMVRLSLVNLYLHGFTAPHIYEYDTLTSLDRWNEYADVILANPPFMSPKGGIKPHNRFSVKSKRSEVLFVDYMAEHLTPNGRAGIIVPEGIIFQSQNAYKKLRRTLVEDYLVAVVSLPAGVFNPYSGVKTSILILDQSLAKQTGTIAFFKVENDGFGLGAQRRPIDKNDLPPALAEITEYLRRLRSRESVEDFQPTLGLVVPKEKIAENGAYNLGGERYRENSLRQSIFPLRRFEEICTLEYGASLPKKKRIDGPYPVVGSNGITGYHKDYLVEGPAIVVGRKGSAGEVTWIEENCFPIDTTYYIKQTNQEQSALRYLYWLLKTLNLPDLRGGAGIPGLNRTDVYNSHQIPLPPLDVQKELVAEIDGYQKVIDGARAVLDNYRPHISSDPDWPMVALRELCSSIRNGYPVEQTDEPGQLRVTRIRTIADGTVDLDKSKWTNDTVPADRLMQPGEILFSHINSIDHLAKTAIFVRASVPVVHGINLIRLQPKRNIVIPEFLLWSLKQERFIEKAKTFAQRAVNQASIKVTDIREMKIPLPPFATQQAIVAEIEAEQEIVNANRDLIDRMEKKIQAALARVWGEDKEDSAEA